MKWRAAWGWLALTAGVFLPWGIAAAQDAPSTDVNTAASAVIADCIGQIDDAPTGLPELEKRCPQLGQGLQDAQVRSLIIPSSRDLLDRASLLQLRQLLHPAVGPSPSVAKLAPFLPAEPTNATAPRSWWQRLWDWVRQHFDHGSEDSADSWFSQVARQLAGARSFWKVIFWGALIVLPIAVVIIVVREVRAMGRRSSDAPATSTANTIAGAPSSHLALLHQAPLGQRPARLFALLIGRLVAAGRLPPDRSLTHREVLGSVVLDDPDQRRFIESLACLAERQLYAEAATSADGLEELLARGEDLYTTGWGQPVET